MPIQAHHGISVQRDFQVSPGGFAFVSETGNKDLQSSAPHGSPDPGSTPPAAQPPSLPPPQSDHVQVRKIIWRIVLASACTLLIGLLVLIGYTIWLTGRTSGFLAVQDSALSHASPLAPDTQNAINASVEASMKRDEALLDKLILLVGLYSTILSFLALGTVVFSRQDAKEQLAAVEKNATDLAASVQTRLEAIKSEADNNVKGLLAQVRSEFPIIAQLQTQLKEHIQALEAKYPDDRNWNAPRSSSWPIQLKQQDMLIDEARILTVSVVALDDSNLQKLYLALARSYMERYRTGDPTDSDAARAYLYTSRAIDRDGKNALAYRTRGVISLARFNLVSTELQKTEEFQQVLFQAKSDLRKCFEIDAKDAGALYNLALAASYEGDFNKAVQISEQLHAMRRDISRDSQERFLPGAYVNWLCFLASQAKAPDCPDRDELLTRIKRTCQVGSDFLSTEVKSTQALADFKAGLNRELQPGKDLDGLPEETRLAIKAFA
jgi:hypothetical protein